MRKHGIEEAKEHDEPGASMLTGVTGQVLNIDGWFASHADTGTPGPHVRLWARGRHGPVLKTSQIPELVECLELVAERIDREWERSGDEYPFGDEPDDNDPAVIRQREIARLFFLQKLRTHFVEVAEILLRSQDLLDASAAIAPLLGIDEVEVAGRLNGINLFAMTSYTSEAISRDLAALRAED
ncbi:hypothetical protein [Nocardioides gilvus]|uniref:hypothetical protein n=1 Tax=Nocardioides gilvus TaxID=1735589 RepID=UPI0013A5430A|nr:hypothetical protein [Nocardioides gilvus]